MSIKNNSYPVTSESVCNKMGTSKPAYHKPDSSILTYREILLLQPEKEDVLDQWFEAIGNCWPYMNSTPVMDITDMKVYPGYSLGEYSTIGTVQALAFRVKKSVITGEPVGRSYEGFYPEYNGHMFVPVSKVDIAILKESLAKYKTNKKKQEKLESLSKTLETLQKEIAELKNS